MSPPPPQLLFDVQPHDELTFIQSPSHDFGKYLRRVVSKASLVVETATDGENGDGSSKASDSIVLYAIFGSLAVISLMGLIGVYWKKIRKCFRRCSRRMKTNRSKSIKVSALEQEQFSSLDKILFASNKSNTLNPASSIVEESSMSNASSDFSEFADLMTESFAKKSKEREDLEKRFGQPLL